jgi:hypothetical protein
MATNGTPLEIEEAALESECGGLDAVTESEFVASRKFLNGRQKPHQKLIVRLDRRARALGIFRHRGHSLEKFDQGRCPWTQEVRRKRLKG